MNTVISLQGKKSHLQRYDGPLYWEVEDPEYQEVQILHYIRNPEKELFKYRRHLLNDYLNDRYNVKTVISDEEMDCKADVCIISAPQRAWKVLDNCKKYNIPYIYDRTDYWKCYDKSPVDTEDDIIKNADYVICSSQYIYDNTDNPNKILLPNMARKFYYYTPLPKENIAVYVGSTKDKIDIDYCHKLIEEHPDFKFISVNVPIDGFIYKSGMKWHDMMDYLSKAKIGLVPIKSDDFHMGQFNLKVWDYIQAHLSVLVTNDYNYKGIKNVHTEWTTDYVDEEVKYWDFSIFDKLLIKYTNNMEKQ